MSRQESPAGAPTSAEYDVLCRNPATDGGTLIERITAQGSATQYTDDGTKTGCNPADMPQRFYKIRP